MIYYDMLSKTVIQCYLKFSSYNSFTISDGINHCKNFQCENNGICVNFIYEAKCYCPDGYTGNQCQYEIDYCCEVECKNGWTCVNSKTGFTCECLQGFLGKIIIVYLFLVQ